MDEMFPGAGPREPGKTCAWCGEPAAREVVCQPAKFRLDRGTRVLAKAAITAPACDHHFKTIRRAG